MASRGLTRDMAATNKLLVLSPAMTITPSRPPFRTFSSVSSLNPALGLAPLWHFRHEALIKGWMSFSNVTPCCVEAGGNFEVSTLLMSHFFWPGVGWAKAEARERPRMIVVNAMPVFILV